MTGSSKGTGGRAPVGTARAAAQSLAVGVAAEVTCTALGEDGDGLVAVQGLRIHVPGLLPGEAAEVKIDSLSHHVRKGLRDAWATLVCVTRPSSNRVAPACPAFGACGGCRVQHLAAAAQLTWKTARVAEALRAQPSLTSVEIAPCLPSAATLGYRNQAKYVCARDAQGRLILGAYKPRTHEVIDLAGCRTIEPALETVVTSLLSLLRRADVVPFDEQKQTGTLRYVVLRSNAAGEVLVTMVIATGGAIDWQLMARALVGQHPTVAGVVISHNDSPGNVIFAPQGRSDRIVAGRGYLEERVGDAKVRLSPRSFAQINRAVARQAYERIARAVVQVPNLQTVVDAYAGVGAIALTVAAAVPSHVAIVGIENNPAATADAEVSHNRPHMTFVTADVAVGLASLAAADVVILNPPRAGCAPKVLAQVIRLRPRLVAYLSCNPETLARDLEILQASDLSVAAVQPFDMLPHTTHIETLALLTER